MVPVAAAAHLHHEDLELTQRHRQHRQLRQRAGLAGGLLEFVAVNVVDVGEVLPAADRAPLVGGLAVEPGGVLQVRRGVADLVRADPAGETSRSSARF